MAALTPTSAALRCRPCDFELLGRGAMKLFDLNGRVAVITVGNAGIGLGIAKGLAAAGAVTVIAARRAEKNL